MPNPKNEPAVITSLLVAAIGDAATLGLIGTSTRDLLVTAITTAVPIIFGLVVRAMVTPNSKVPAVAAATEPTRGNTVADAAPDDSASSASSEVPVNEVPMPEPAPAEPAPPAPVEDPVKAQLKAAIETVRANSNALNDARAQAAKAAVDASS